MQTNCKHPDLIVQRNEGYRWVTCTECHTDFIPDPDRWVVVTQSPLGVRGPYTQESAEQKRDELRSIGRSAEVCGLM